MIQQSQPLLSESPAIASDAAGNLGPAPRSSRLVQIILAIIVFAMLLRPGDAPWINDEPHLIELAAAFSAVPCQQYFVQLSFTPAYCGLLGTRGAYYGPGAVWFYQLLLVFTHDLHAVVVVHAAFMAITLALGLYWLTRVLRVTPWLAVVVMLSPWMWQYCRQAWDNSFNISLSTLLVAGYGDFLITRRVWSLRLVLFCLVVMPLIHFMCMPLIIALALHLAVFHFRELLKWKWSVLGILAAIEFLAWPYWYFASRQYHHSIPYGLSSVAGWLYPLAGAHHLTAGGMSEILGPDWLNSLNSIWRNCLVAATWFTFVAFPICWAGTVLAAWRGWRIFFPSKKSPLEDHLANDHLAAIALAAWILQTILDGVEKVYLGPHYYNGTWIVYLLFVWLAIKFSRSFFEKRRPLGGILLAAYALSLVIAGGSVYYEILRDGGSRFLGYGTTLDNQLSAMTQIKGFAPYSNREIRIPQWEKFPWAFNDIEKSAPAPPGPKPYRRIVIRYSDASPTDARIVVEDSPMPRP